MPRTPPEKLEEDALIREARRRGKQGEVAFAELVERHQAWVLRMLFYLLGNSEDAEEVAQDTFLRAFLALDRFRGMSSFKTWLRVIATRLAYNHHRDRSTRVGYIDKFQETAPRVTPNCFSRVADRDSLHRVLMELPFPYREVLELRHVEELSQEEIAQVLDLGLSAVKMRLSRARDRFWELHEEMVKNE